MSHLGTVIGVNSLYFSTPHEMTKHSYSPFQVVDSVPPWSWGLWKAGTWSFLTAMLTLCSSTTSMTRGTWLEKKRSISAQVGSPASGPSQALSHPSACIGEGQQPQEVASAEARSAPRTARRLLDAPQWGHLPASPAFPTSPLPSPFLLHSRGSPQSPRRTRHRHHQLRTVQQALVRHRR